MDTTSASEYATNVKTLVDRLENKAKKGDFKSYSKIEKVGRVWCRVG